MSFILDALRKSEHERRMETAPDIMHAPAAVARQTLPAWTVLLIAALAAALIAVSLMSWWQRSGGSATEVAAEPVRSTPAPATPAGDTAVPAASQSAPAEVRAAPTPALPSTEPIGEAIATVQPRSSAPAAAPAVPESAPVPTAAPPAAAAPRVNPAELPVYPAVLSEGLSVGTLQMQLHVHSSAPANRFVVINGSRQREGDRLTEGPVVEEIVPEGAVLSYQGRRFLLTAN